MPSVIYLYPGTENTCVSNNYADKPCSLFYRCGQKTLINNYVVSHVPHQCATAALTPRIWREHQPIQQFHPSCCGFISSSIAAVTRPQVCDAICRRVYQLYSYYYANRLHTLSLHGVSKNCAHVPLCPLSITREKTLNGFLYTVFGINQPAVYN